MYVKVKHFMNLILVPIAQHLIMPRAALLQQEANLSTLRTKLNRYQQLVSSNAVAKQDYDDLVGQVNVAEAQVAAARAQVKNAEVDLGYSTIRSPISGQTNRSTVTAGALVTANQTEPLVTIQRLDPIYVDINQSSLNFFVCVNN